MKTFASRGKDGMYHRGVSGGRNRPKPSPVEGGSWNTNPFAELEKLLPVNVIAIKEMDERIRRKLSHIDDAYKGKSSEFVANYRKEMSALSLSVVSLALPAKQLAMLKVKALIFAEYGAMNVKSWPDALSQFMLYIASEKEDVVDIMDIGGLLWWVKKNNPADAMCKAWQEAKCSVDFPRMSAVCARLQWLFLMCGISLIDVGVCYEDVDKQKNVTRESILSQVSQQHNSFSKESKNAKQMRRHKEQQYSKKRVHQKHGDFGRSMYSTTISPGTYIIENGMPVFVKQTNANTDTAILHSASDVEDRWRGMGHFARDNGRFGSISGEDYAD